MNLIELNWSPSDRQLRQFAAIAAVAVPLVGWLWGANGSVLALLFGIGLAVAGLGVAMPRAMKPVFLGLSIVAFPIGIILSELTMLLIYFTVLTPIGLALRLGKRDALERKIDRSATSYWTPKKPTQNAASYYHQS